MNYAKLFRVIACVTFAAGLIAGSYWLYVGLPLWGVVAIASGFFTAHLWGAGAAVFDQLADIRRENAEILQQLARMWADTHPEDQYRQYVPASIAPPRGGDGPRWPNILVARQPIATHNGINISPGLMGAWLAKQGGETTSFESAADLAGWLDTLPKPRN